MCFCYCRFICVEQRSALKADWGHKTPGRKPSTIGGCAGVNTLSDLPNDVQKYLYLLYHSSMGNGYHVVIRLEHPLDDLPNSRCVEISSTYHLIPSSMDFLGKAEPFFWHVPSGNDRQIAIEHGPVEIVDIPYLPS